MKTRRPCPRRSSCPASISLQAGQRIGLLGINGAGKSTFIKTIAGELQSLAGDTQFNKGLSIGYFAQHQVEMLRHDESPLWHMTNSRPMCASRAAQLPGQFQFHGAMATSPITPFSGGEGAAGAGADRLAAPQLLLDEPTNHLDLETREADQRWHSSRHAGAGLARPSPAARQHRPVHHRGRRSVRPFDGDLDDYKAWLYQTSCPPRRPEATPPGLARV